MSNQSRNEYMKEWRKGKEDALNAKRRERLRNDPEYRETLRLKDKARRDAKKEQVNEKRRLAYESRKSKTHLAGFTKFCTAIDCGKEFVTDRVGGNICQDCRRFRKNACQARLNSLPGTKAKARDRNYRRNYGLSDEEVQAKAIAQEMKCAACGKIPKPDRLGRTLAVDHDHQTGVVRELLCFLCNAAIGMAKENPEILTLWANYLTKHAAKQ